MAGKDILPDRVLSHGEIAEQPTFTSWERLVVAEEVELARAVLQHLPPRRRRVLLVHGELRASQALAHAVAGYLGHEGVELLIVDVKSAALASVVSASATMSTFRPSSTLAIGGGVVHDVVKAARAHMAGYLPSDELPTGDGALLTLPVLSGGSSIFLVPTRLGAGSPWTSRTVIVGSDGRSRLLEIPQPGIRCHLVSAGMYGGLSRAEVAVDLLEILARAVGPALESPGHPDLTEGRLSMLDDWLACVSDVEEVGWGEASVVTRLAELSRLAHSALWRDDLQPGCYPLWSAVMAAVDLWGVRKSVVLARAFPQYLRLSASRSGSFGARLASMPRAVGMIENEAVLAQLADVGAKVANPTGQEVWEELSSHRPDIARHSLARATCAVVASIVQDVG